MPNESSQDLGSGTFKFVGHFYVSKYLEAV